MQNVQFKPSSETQLQHWIEKLKEAGVPYDLVTKGTSTFLSVDKEAAKRVLNLDPPPSTAKSCLLVGVAIMVGIFILGLIIGPSDTEEAEKGPFINAPELFFKPVENMQAAFGEPSTSVEHNDKYPCENMECLKQAYADGKYEVFVLRGNVVYMSINDVEDVPFDYEAIESIGFPEKMADDIAPSVIRWNYQNYQVSAFPDGTGHVDYFLLIPAELAY